jgi:hypothetical protein
MTRWLRSFLLLAAFLGFVTASLWWIQVTPGSPRAAAWTAPALGINLSVAAAALVRLGLAVKRPMLSIGILGGVFLLTADICLLIPNTPDSRYDPDYLESIKPGMPIEHVERILGISLAGICHPSNTDRSYFISTTRQFSLPPHHEWKDWSVAEESFLVQFDDNGIVLRMEKGWHQFRAETFFERVKRHLGFK